MDVAGLFYGIGHQPNSGLVAHRVEVDDKGYVKVRRYGGWSEVRRYGGWSPIFWPEVN